MTFERKNIADMQGYQSGEQPNDELTIKLNTNENPYPPSPMVEKTINNLDFQNTFFFSKDDACNLIIIDISIFISQTLK